MSGGMVESILENVQNVLRFDLAQKTEMRNLWFVFVLFFISMLKVWHICDPVVQQTMK